MKFKEFVSWCNDRTCDGCCGTCGNNTYDDGEFVCGCEASDAYGCSTAYTDHCEEWCEK